MKKLPPNGAIIPLLSVYGLVSIIIIFLISVNGVEFGKNIFDDISWIILSFGPILLGVYMAIDVYCSNCIQYGNGRIIIKRRNKKIVNGRPVGKWETKEDEFLLEEIEIYALASQSFGFHRYVEFHPSNMGVFSRECVFQLKDGRRISYESTYYTRKEEMELIRYVHNEAGIEFQGPPMSKW